MDISRRISISVKQNTYDTIKKSGLSSISKYVRTELDNIIEQKEYLLVTNIESENYEYKKINIYIPLESKQTYDNYIRSKQNVTMQLLVNSILNELEKKIIENGVLQKWLKDKE